MMEQKNNRKRKPLGARCAMVMHLTYNRQEILKQWKESQNV